MQLHLRWDSAHRLLPEVWGMVPHEQGLLSTLLHRGPRARQHGGLQAVRVRVQGVRWQPFGLTRLLSSPENRGDLLPPVETRAGTLRLIDRLINSYQEYTLYW